MSPNEPVTGTSVSTERVSCGNCGCTIDRKVAQVVDNVPLCLPCSNGEPCPRCNPGVRISDRQRAKIGEKAKCMTQMVGELYREMIEEQDLSDEEIEELVGGMDSGQFMRSTGGVHLDRAWRELKDVGYDDDPIRIVIEPEMAVPEDHHYRIRFEPLELVSVETGEPVDGPAPMGIDTYEYRSQDEVGREQSDN